MGSSSVVAPAKLEVRPIAGSLGAEVIGLDFSAVSAVADELRKALNEHLVLFMPGWTRLLKVFVTLRRRSVHLKFTPTLTRSILRFPK